MMAADHRGMGLEGKNVVVLGVADESSLAWAIAKAPWKIFALIRLYRRTSFAAQQLANVLAKAVW